MATQSKFSYSPHQLTGAGNDEVASRNHGIRKKFKRPIAHCKFSSSQTDRITQEFAYSLIAWVVGKDIRPWKLARHLHRHLRLKEDLEVFELGLGYFVLKFSETDFLALEDNPWPVPNLCIYAFPWTPNFKPSEATDSSIDAWIRLHELSIEYYDEEILGEIAKVIGESLVKIDPVTKCRLKCKYARICVRISLCEPLPSTIRLGNIHQEIEYEGFDLLCPLCRRVIHLKHVCLNSSASSRFEPHYRRARSFQDTGSSSNPNQPLISSTPSVSWGSRYEVLVAESNAPLQDLNDLPSPSVSWGSRYEVLGAESNAPLQDLNDLPSPSMGDSEEAATRTSTGSLLPQLPGLLPEPIKENQEEECGVSVQAFPNLPEESALQEDLPQSHPISISSNLEESSSSTVTPAPALEQNNLNLSVALPRSLVEDQFTPAEPSCSTTLKVNNDQPQPSPSAATASISTLQRSSSTSKTVPAFCLSGIERSILEKEITNTLSQGFGINRRPILYTIDESVESFEIGLSDNSDSAPKQNQFVINMVATPRSGNKHGIGSKAKSSLDSKKMLGWNFRGMDDANLIEGLKYMVHKYGVSIVVVFGTKITDDVVEEVVDELGFHGSYCKKFDDYHRGVWLFMFRQDVQTEVFEVNSYSTQQVSASIYFQSEINEPMASFSFADTGSSSQMWGLASFGASTYSTANALAY